MSDISNTNLIQTLGKTTLTTALQHLFTLENKHCEILSLDDFYLTADDQSKVAEMHANNPLLQYRGNAGTHDLPLLRNTLQSLRLDTDMSTDTAQTDTSQTDTSAHCVRIPRYDKSLREGRGDRAPEEAWSVVKQTPDVVLLEGWMFGFEPLHGERHAALSEEMKDINTYLQSYTSIHCLMDAWLVIDAEHINYVYKWRQEAETEMSRSGKPSMSEIQVYMHVAVLCYVGWLFFKRFLTYLTCTIFN